MHCRVADFALIAVLLAMAASHAGAQSPPSNFTTVINVPPDPSPAVVGSNTQLNVHPNASLSGLQAGNPGQSNTNVEVNFYGGWGGAVTGNSGAKVNVLGGSIGYYSTARSGSLFNVMGGSLSDYFTAESGSQVNINSGIVGERFVAKSGSGVKISGGVFDEDFDALAGSGFRIYGGEFRLNGNLISGLTAVGQQVSITPGTTFVLSGTLADGTPFSFSSYDNQDVITSVGKANDSFGGSVTLVREALPAIGPAAVNVPAMPIPTGVRAGQTLTVSAGAVVPSNFNAGYGSSVVMQGGQMGDNFEATWANVRIEGGVVNSYFDAIGSNVTITGGTIGNSFEAMRGSQVNIAGGLVRGLQTWSNTTVTMTGGTAEQLSAKSGSTLTLSGGSYGEVWIQEGAAMTASGGTFGDGPAAFTGGSFALVGADFRLNGEPVLGFTSIGQTQQIDILQGQLLTGVLADGTPFAFQNVDDADTFYAGTLRLQLAETPAIGPAVVVASGGGVTYGLRAGQTLIVDNGGVVPANFNAARGTTVVIEAGGTVGDNFEAVGSNVTIAGGTIGRWFDAFAGTNVHVTSGTIMRGFEALPGSTVVVDGGNFDDLFEVNRDSNVTINGGDFRGPVNDSFYALAGSDAVINGGTFRAIRTKTNGTLFVHGGAFGKITTEASSVLTLYGDEFQLNGVPVAGLDQVGNSVIHNLPSGALLTGVLSDGTPLAFSTLDSDVVANGTLRLERATIPVAEPGVIDVATDGTPPGVRAGQTLVVGGGAAVRDYFNAAPGSVTRVEAGGSIGVNFEVVGGKVFVEGGTIGSDFDAFRGSEVFVTSGTVTGFVNHVGSVVRVTGGQIGGRTLGMFDVSGGEVKPNSSVGAGGVMNIAGGTVGSGLNVDSGGTVNITGGTVGSDFDAASLSFINLYGTEFSLNGLPIDGLELNEPFLLASRDGALSGLLLDGSPFSFDLNSVDATGEDWFSSGASLKLHLSIPGDFNLDGVVEAADYVLWRKNGGSLSQLAIWRTHFGQTAGSGSSSSVNAAAPEPSTQLMLVLAATCVYSRRSRPHKKLR